MQQYKPSTRLNGMPCSLVALVSASSLDCFTKLELEKIIKRCDKTGYMSLKNMENCIKEKYKIVEVKDFNKKFRPTLEHILDGNTKRGIVCVVGHFLYIEGEDYFSFFDNLKDRVVKIWFLQ